MDGEMADSDMQSKAAGLRLRDMPSSINVSACCHHEQHFDTALYMYVQEQ